MKSRIGDTIRVWPGYVGWFTREQAPGCMPNGARVVKQGSLPGDGTTDGTPGVVLGSLCAPDVNEGRPLYFIEWASSPKVAVAVASHRLRRADT